MSCTKSCSGKQQNSDFGKKRSIEELVKEYLYKKKYNKFFKKELTDKEAHEEYLSSLQTLTDFICGEVNVDRVPKGNKYILNGHQRRPLNGKWDLINKMGQNLKDLDNESFDDFEQLFEYIKSKKVDWFGPTSFYDIALRHGWHRKPRVEPVKYVYAHAKLLNVAKKLEELGYLKKAGPRMPIEDFSKEIRQPGMTASDIEHFICMKYTDILNLERTK